MDEHDARVLRRGSKGCAIRRRGTADHGGHPAADFDSHLSTMRTARPRRKCGLVRDHGRGGSAGGRDSRPGISHGMKCASCSWADADVA
jgi:hypothetical protein